MEDHFKVKNEEGELDFHRIDRAGNHFINGRCANPIHDEGKIGDTHPAKELRIYSKKAV